MGTSTTILQRIARGDESAVVECVDTYGGIVWRLASRYLGSSKGELEDAVQEVFVELWMHAGRFDATIGSEPSFVATIAHRRLIDYQRKRRRHLMPSTEQVLEPKSDVPESLQRIVHDQSLDAVAEAFDQLPDDERRALWMSIWGGLSHRQIAEATNTAIGTVKTRLRRALRRLHDSVHAEGGAR
ncbi:MAG: sigma-70 family RNA polymerase sigma factor [Phycisphaerales bacterium]|nr:sigma-70 family RNA polymerase sigma factor [Phycisphaerales bacterium]